MNHFLLFYMSGVTPQESFYHFINQEWISNNKIPSGYSRWSRFNELADKTLKQLKELLPNVKDNRLNKLINFFENYEIEREYVFMKGLVDEINGLDTIKDILEYYQRKLMLFGVGFLYNLGVESDMKNSNHNILYLGPGRLSLPGRDYYLEDQFKDKREEYVKFVNRLMEFYKMEIRGEDILELETKLAELHLKPEDKRNPENVYFLKTEDEVINYNIPLEVYFELVGERPGNTEDKIVCSNERYFENYLTGVNKEALKKYLIYKTLLRFSKTSQGELYDIIYNFYGVILSGQKEKLPQWKRTINLINGTLGELLSKEYIKLHFSQEAKSQVSEMIGYFKNVIKEMIEKNTWMDESTKERALEKLEKINWKIGYPDKWKNFSTLDFNDCNSLSECLARTSEWWFYDEGTELFKKTDLQKWEMLAHQVNAYYHPLLNEIVFPAAILQEPFFSLERGLAENYGGIGVVIAHEITHGFDDQGKRFDANGNLNNWWTKDDEERFQQEANKLEKQFDNLELYDTKLNGKLTLGENLADLGGVRISLAALTKKLGNITDEDKKKFFESFARIWANLCAYEEGQKLIKIDPHSPGEFRVNGILPHLDEFHETYNIKQGDKMFMKPEDRCQIWCL